MASASGGWICGSLVSLSSFLMMPLTRGPVATGFAMGLGSFSLPFCGGEIDGAVRRTCFGVVVKLSFLSNSKETSSGCSSTTAGESVLPDLAFLMAFPGAVRCCRTLCFLTWMGSSGKLGGSFRVSSTTTSLYS